MSDYVPDEDEEEAGVAIFAGFGFFSTVVSLSRVMSCSYDDILAMSADVVYMTLLIDFEQSEYQKRLMEIKRRNEKLKG